MGTKAFRITIAGLICLVALISGLAVSFISGQTTTAYAEEVTQNTVLNVAETRINGWRALQDMTIYGENTDSGCGMTAMAILLQYYNDNSLYAGEILPDEFDYNNDAGTDGNNVCANALRER